MVDVGDADLDRLEGLVSELDAGQRALEELAVADGAPLRP
jgi:hypothetical protein